MELVVGRHVLLFLLASAAAAGRVVSPATSTVANFRNGLLNCDPGRIANVDVGPKTRDYLEVCPRIERGFANGRGGHKTFAGRAAPVGSDIFH
jgi:hypothetical protein